MVNALDVHFDELRVASKRLPELPSTEVLSHLLSLELEAIPKPRQVQGIHDEVAPIRYPLSIEEVATTGPISLLHVSLIPEPTHAEPSYVPNRTPSLLRLRKTNTHQRPKQQIVVHPRVRVEPSPNSQGGKPEETSLRRALRLDGIPRANVVRVPSIEESDPTSYRKALAHKY